MSVLSAPHFHNEEAAILHLESILWPNGANCPHCGSVERLNKLKGKSVRPGLWKCYACRKQFTVKVGTVFESSHVPVHKWLQAAFLMASSKKGISAHQIHRTLEVQYNTAWFMAHRLREAMRVLNIEPMGGEGSIVEADETFVGGLEKNKHARDRKHQGRGAVGKEAVFSLVERGGRVRSTHVPSVSAETLGKVMREQLYTDTHLMTDDARQYIPLGKHFMMHESVNHSIGEYVRGGTHTNTIEGYFSIFKRGMKGVYQHCNAKHLKRYLCEFDFRYNERDTTDAERMITALQGIKGKRLTYRA
ncbi:IS1595 family transposase [Fimbriiglobus ruber]|uniref:IS1595 family transposase n=1 Tax=Fimbriiglobus ruber TaxID=1908690 RepID=UPI000B4BE4DB|nr:IS1595 family transposase [Fimbriiglobus ruber]